MLIWRLATCLLRERRAERWWFGSAPDDRLPFKVRMWLGEGRDTAQACRNDTLTPHVPPPCVSLETNLFILAAPKQAYAAANCNLFYLMRHSLNYHLSFYSSPLSWNEPHKTFQSVFFFPPTPPDCMWNLPANYKFFLPPCPCPLFLKKFLQFTRKRQTQETRWPYI